MRSLMTAPPKRLEGDKLGSLMVRFLRYTGRAALPGLQKKPCPGTRMPGRNFFYKYYNIN